MAMPLRAQTPRQFFFLAGAVLIVSFGFALRLYALRQGMAQPLDRDPLTYFQLAHVLQQDPLHYTEIFRPPLYPAFLALIFNFAGDSRFSVGVVQTLIDTCNIALVLALARRVFQKPRISLLAALLYAVYPEAIAMAGTLFSESLFLLLSGAGVLLLLNPRHRRADKFFLAGILFGSAALAREILAYFALALVPLWIWLTQPRGRKTLTRIIFFLGGLALVLTPWSIRNWQIESRFVLISTSGEFNLVKDNLPARVAMLAANPALRQKLKGNLKIPRTDVEALKLIAEQPPAARANYATRVALHIIGLDPLQWLAFKASDAAAFFNLNSRLTPFAQQDNFPVVVRRGLRLFAGGYVVALLVLAVVGLIFSRANAAKFLVLLYVAYSFGIFILTHFQIRYRIPLVALLIPYSAFALVEWKMWFKFSKRSLAAFALAAVILILALSQTI